MVQFPIKVENLFLAFHVRGCLIFFVQFTASTKLRKNVNDNAFAAFFGLCVSCIGISSGICMFKILKF